MLVQRVADYQYYYGKLLKHVAGIHACTELAAFDVEDINNINVLCHIRGEDEVDKKKKQSAINAFIDTIRPCITAGKDGAIEIIEDPPPQRPQYCLVILAKRAQKILRAAAFIVRCNNREDAKSLLNCVQVQTERFRNNPE